MLLEGKVNDSAAIEKDYLIPIAAYAQMVAAQPKLGEVLPYAGITIGNKKALKSKSSIGYFFL
ncbi:MAG: hypothetical protein IPP79_01230 [Chitinophagaceae bacterium]|nr:hypothetical protein [Chitinophagaceae bacterium]